MNIVQGIHHKRTIEDILISVLQAVIVAGILVILAMFAVDAWIIEDDARVAKLNEKIYGVTQERSYPRPNPYDLAAPKTRVFADTSNRKAVK